MCFAVFDTRLKRRLLFVFSAVAVTVILAVTLAFCFSESSGNKDYAFDLNKTGGVGSFLGQFSLEYESQESSRVLTLPDKSDSTFAEYDSLQGKIGLGILKFSGKKVEERYLKLKNKNSKGQRFYAVLYIHKSKVIGAHLTTMIEGSENLPLTAFV